MAESTLAQRIKAEFDAKKQRTKESDEARAKESQARETRMAKFTKGCEDLKAVWRPRFEEFAKQFGEQIKITPTVSPSQREAKISFLTELATITLTFTVAPDPGVTKMVLDYDLLIVPIYFEYERHSRLEIPLDKIDSAAVGKWLDDRLVSCVKAYLTIQDNEHYLRRALVEDPVSKARFLREDAAATIEHKGQKLYFKTAETLNEYKKKHQITA